MQSLEPFRYDPSRRCWISAGNEAERPHRRLALVTYNVWFGDYLWQERFAALLDRVRVCGPDVAALQEMTPRHLEYLLAQEWVRGEYRVSDITGSTVEPHGVLLLSRLPLRNMALCELPSDKDRKLLVGVLGLAERSICLGNLHLESSADATAVRLAQLDSVLPSLSGAPHSVLMGDFNFDPAQKPEQARVDWRYRDLWAELWGNEPGYTEDTDINRMRLVHKGKEKQVRYDRILLRSSRPGWEPESVRMIGTQPISPDYPDVFPSDHFGLAGTLVWSGLHK